MASGTVTGGASAAGAMPASGAPLLGSTTDLLQQLHQAQSLLKTADGAMQPAALQLLWARSSGAAATGSGVLIESSEDLVKDDADLETALLARHDSTGKEYSMKQYKKKVREAVTALLIKIRAQAYSQAQAQWDAVGTETAKAAAHEIYKVTTHVNDLTTECERLVKETRIRINGIESSRKAAQTAHAAMELKLKTINTEITECKEKATGFSKLSTGVWTGDLSKINSSATDQISLYESGRKAMEGRIRQLEASRLLLYSSGDGSSVKGDLKTITQLLPNGAAKSSAYQ